MSYSISSPFFLCEVYVLLSLHYKYGVADFRKAFLPTKKKKTAIIFIIN